MESRRPSSWKIFVYRVLGKIHHTFHLLLHFLFKAANCGKKEELPAINNLILLTPATSLAMRIRKKKLKSTDLVESYISRIKEVNPYINALVADQFDKAVEKAKEVDLLIESGTKTEEELERETPFLGVPFSSKELIAVAGMPITGGLVSRKNILAEQDCEVVKLMRDAGAIPLGVTNIGEMAMWVESHNKVYGRTMNPHDTSRSAGGSSGGEGALVAAAGSVIGLGNDVAGSIRIPSCFNGIFGHKPSTGVVSNKGTYSTVNEDLDCFLSIGPMCRYATDLLPMMKVLSHENSAKLKLDTPVNLENLKIYYMECAGDFGCFSRVQSDIKNAMGKALRHFENAYKIKPQKLEVRAMRHAVDISFCSISEKGGFKLREKVVENRGKLNIFVELLLWLIGQSQHTFHLLSLLIFEKISPRVIKGKKASMKNKCSEALQLFQEQLGENGVFFYPTWPEGAPHHNESLFKPFDFAYTALFNILGLPVTHCPLGLNREGLPIGIQVISNFNNDRLCMAVAVELEKAFGGWICPSPIVE